MERQSQRKSDKQRAVLRQYYLETDYFMSTEGVLKILSILLCTASSILFLWGGWCSPGRAGGAGVAALAGAVALVMCACASTALAVRAPMTCFIIDLVLYTVVGVSLFVIAVLSVALCEMKRIIDYIYGPLAFINSGMVVSSAVTFYMSVTKRWDADTEMDNTRPSRNYDNELDV